MKCANCNKDSLFEYKLTLEKSLFYCGKHLPKFLDARKKADLLAITDAFTQAKTEAIEILSEPAPVPVEEVVAPKPKKKAAKKKAE